MENSAKAEVIDACELLSICYPNLSDDRIQEVAIDLHDIEHACREIAQLINDLRSGAVLPEDVRKTLRNIEYELVTHIGRSHLPTLRKFIKECTSHQPGEKKAKKGNGGTLRKRRLKPEESRE